MLNSTKEILVIGAGNIGLGVVGRIFSDNGYKLYFYRRQEDLLKNLKKQGYYTVVLKGKSDTIYQSISNFEIVTRDTLVRKLTEIDLVACCVYESAFDDICRNILEAIANRSNEKPDSKLNILICTNNINAVKKIHALIVMGLGQNAKTREYYQENVGICQVLVLSAGSPAPIAIREKDNFAVASYKNGHLEVDKDCFKGELLDLHGISFVSEVQQKLYRKIYLGNMRHTMAAFLGKAFGYQMIDQCHQDKYIRYCIIKAFLEAEQALLAEYKFDDQEYQIWRKEIMDKLDIPIQDSIMRVAHDPIRKLGRNNRFIAPALLCIKHQILPYYIAKGIAYGFSYKNENDNESLEIGKYVQNNGIELAILHYCNLDIKNKNEKLLFDIIVDQYCDLEMERSRWKRS
jgi:Mannitol-1-phosphate/altronate dehydrogenases